MRAIRIFLVLAISLSASAQEYRYLIPFTGYLATSDGTYYHAYTVVQSLTPRDCFCVDSYGVRQRRAAAFPQRG